MNFNKSINMNQNVFYTSKKYKELLIWINSIESTYLSKSIKSINDLKDGNVFMDLLKIYFKINKNRYYYSLLDSLFNSSNSIEKMKIIFRLIPEMTNNNEIISRIQFFQNNIDNFLDNDDLIMELVLYINHIYNNENDLSNKKKQYFSHDKKINSKRSLKDFYDYNKYKRIIVNNVFNQNEDNKINKVLNKNKLDNFSCKNLNVVNINNLNFNIKNNDRKSLYNNIGQKQFIYRPKNTAINMAQKFNKFKDNINPPQIYNDDNSENKLINSENLFNMNNQNQNKEKILYTEQENKRKALLNDLDKINNIIYYPTKYKNNNDNYFKNTKKNFGEENRINEICFKKDNNSKNYNRRNINNIFGIFNNKIYSSQEDEQTNFFKILKLTNPILDVDNFDKINPKLIINKEQNGIKKESLEDNFKENNFNNNINRKNYINKFKSINSTLENERGAFFSRLKKQKNNEKYYQKFKKEDSPIKNLINNMDAFEKKIKRQNSYILGKNEKNRNKLNNLIENKRSLSYLNLNNKDNNNAADNISKTYNTNNNNIKVDNKNNNEIDKKEIYNWLLYLNIIKKENANLILLPELVSNGIILCDIINLHENGSNKINGIIRKISSEEEALININKALDYLKKLEEFPKRHVYDNELIFEIEDKVIWELLYDLYNYYSKEEDRIKFKFKEEKIKNLNNKNSSKNNEKNPLFLNKEKYSYQIPELNNNKFSEISNKNKHNNYEQNLTGYEYNRGTQQLYDSNVLTKSYNYYNNTFINNNFTNQKSKNNIPKNKHISIEKSRNFSNNLEDNKLFKKGYFDYVNELKNHFDNVKNNKKEINKGLIQEKNSNMINYSKNSQQPIFLNTKLHFNYDNDDIKYNNKNIKEYLTNSEYNNYADYAYNNEKNNENGIN